MANVNVSHFISHKSSLFASLTKFWPSVKAGSPPINLLPLSTQAQMQLYYYMQKLQTAGMGNPKERKECPICGKTLYDRSTWNRHMRIHTGDSGRIASPS